MDVKDSAEEIAETTKTLVTDIGNNVNEMSSRGGEASGAAASGGSGEERAERQLGPLLLR